MVNKKVQNSSHIFCPLLKNLQLLQTIFWDFKWYASVFYWRLMHIYIYTFNTTLYIGYLIETLSLVLQKWNTYQIKALDERILMVYFSDLNKNTKWWKQNL